MLSPRTEAEITVKAVDEHVLVYDTRNERIHILNTSAASVLQLCDGKKTLQEIALIIKADNEISLDVVENDVRDIWDAFIKLGIAAYEAPASHHQPPAIASAP